MNSCDYMYMCAHMYLHKYEDRDIPSCYQYYCCMVTFLFFCCVFFFLALPHGMCDLSSPTRGRIPVTHPAVEAQSLNH